MPNPHALAKWLYIEVPDMYIPYLPAGSQTKRSKSLAWHRYFGHPRGVLRFVTRTSKRSVGLLLLAGGSPLTARSARLQPASGELAGTHHTWLMAQRLDVSSVGCNSIYIIGRGTLHTYIRYPPLPVPPPRLGREGKPVHTYVRSPGRGRAVISHLPIGRAVSELEEPPGIFWRLARAKDWTDSEGCLRSLRARGVRAGGLSSGAWNRPCWR